MKATISAQVQVSVGDNFTAPTTIYNNDVVWTVMEVHPNGVVAIEVDPDAADDGDEYFDEENVSLIQKDTAPDLAKFIKDSAEMIGSVSITDHLSEEALLAICEEYHKLKLGY